MSISELKHASELLQLKITILQEILLKKFLYKIILFEWRSVF